MFKNNLKLFQLCLALYFNYIYFIISLFNKYLIITYVPGTA